MKELQSATSAADFAEGCTFLPGSSTEILENSKLLKTGKSSLKTTHEHTTELNTPRAQSEERETHFIGPLSAA